jgi:hypothetical protein
MNADMRSNRGTEQLDYAAGNTGPSRVQRVLSELAAAEARGQATIVTKILLGVPLTFLGPALVSSMIVGFSRRLNLGASGFLVTFVVVSAVLVPLLMWYERRTRGEFLTDSVRGETSPFEASSYGEFEMQRSKMAWYGYVEVALTGPRLLWEVIDYLRGSTLVDQPLRLIAAQIAVELFDAGEGRPIETLVREDRPARVAWIAIQYLLRREWVGISSRKDRVWLASDVRERLSRL